MTHNEVGCYSYADAQTCKGDVIDVMTILKGEQAWAKRGYHVRHFVEHQARQGRGVVVIYSNNKERKCVKKRKS